MSDLAAEPGLAMQLPCAALVLDATNCISQANRALATMSGRPLAGLIDQPVETLLTPAASAIFQSYVLPMLTLHGRIEEFALSLRRPDGSTLDVLLYASLRHGESGMCTHAVLAPYRTRKAVDDELLKVKRAADQSPAMIFELVREPSGRLAFTYLSRAVKALFGCTAQQAVADAQKVLGRLRPEDLARLHAHPAGQTDAQHHFSAALQPAAEAQPVVWHEWQASSRLLSDGRIVWAGHVADVSTQRALQSEALQLRAVEHARQAQTDFLGRVSHELRTPLNAILGFTQLLAASAEQADSTLNRRHIQLVGSAGQRLLSLVDDVLGLSSLRSSSFGVQPVALALAPLVEDSLAMLGPLAQRAGVTLSAEIAASLWVLADSSRLTQAIDNLLSNAIKYNRRGGAVRVSAWARDGGVALDVADTGIGLSEEQRLALFQPFNRLGAERSGVDGTGLGLVITAQIVQTLGGRLDVVSTPGQGSCFTVWLPAGTAPAAVAAPDPGAAPAAAAQRCEVLYVEDDPVNALLFEAIAAEVPGLQLRVATSGAMALLMAEERPPALLLCDHWLPDTPAAALLQALRARPGQQALPAVMITADQQSGTEAAARAAGFSQFWAKPLDVNATRAQLGALVARYGS